MELNKKSAIFDVYKKTNMMKKLLYSICLLPVFCIAQNYNIDEHLIIATGTDDTDSFSNNTSFNALVDSVSINWEIILAEHPEGWEFSNCFPNCYQPGVVSESYLFEQGMGYYLNCHFYPHNIPGEATIKMFITDGISSDTVTWQATATSTVGLEEMMNQENSEIEHIFDLNGRIISDVRNHKIVIIRYKNGRTRKVYVTKD